MSKSYYVYILASQKNWTIYIWVTSDLIKRVFEHKEWMTKWFTSEYWVNKLVYYEETSDAISAISREKQLKRWNRDWKIELIEKNNKDWRDLYDAIIG